MFQLLFYKYLSENRPCEMKWKESVFSTLKLTIIVLEKNPGFSRFENYYDFRCPKTIEMWYYNPFFLLGSLYLYMRKFVVLNTYIESRMRIWKQRKTYKKSHAKERKENEKKERREEKIKIGQFAKSDKERDVYKSKEGWYIDQKEVDEEKGR